MRGLPPCLTLVAVLGASGCELMPVSAPASPSPARVRVVRAARLFDARSGTMLTSPQVTLTSDGYIAAVAGDAAPEAGPDVLDLGDVTLLPGLVDAHEHVMANSAMGYLQMLQQRTEAYRTVEGVVHARAILHAGFTTVRDCGNEGLQYADVGLRDAIAGGVIEGPRLFVATRAIAHVGGSARRRYSVPTRPAAPRPSSSRTAPISSSSTPTSQEKTARRRGRRSPSRR